MNPRMFGLVLVMGFGVLAYRSATIRDGDLSPLPRKLSDKLGQLWGIAHQGMRDNRLVRAEKALLTILKIDKRNAAAYNRLGILYAKQKEYKDAIDCFEIASSIENSASSLHNLGLIYYETENYDKAATAFEQALKLEDKLAARHIAYAKVQEKLGNDKLMFQELDKAVELEPSREALKLLLSAYEKRDMIEEAHAIEKKLASRPVASTNQKKRVGRSKRRVVI
jgi:tetratricopeptide (TPR) repeat protein